MVFYARLRGLWKHLKETNKPPAVRVQAVLRVCVDRLQNLMNLAFLLLCAYQGIDSPPDEYFPETKLPLIAAVRKGKHASKLCDLLEIQSLTKTSAISAAQLRPPSLSRAVQVVADESIAVKNARR